MADNLPGLSKDFGAGRPITAAEFKRRDLERRALELWIETQSYVKVKNALKLRSNDVAREMVKRGEARWMEEESAGLLRFKAMVRGDLLRMRHLLMDDLVTDEGRVRLEVVDRALKIGERLSKLLDLDEQRDVREGGGDTYVLAAGGDINLVPKGGRALDARLPWERGEIIEGEAEPLEQPEPPGGGS